MPPLNTEVEEAILQLEVPSRSRLAARPRLWAKLRLPTLLFLVSLSAIAVNGYHPFGEDAGIYVAGIKQAAQPRLYGSSAAFITPYFQLSIFAKWNAALLQTTHLPLQHLLFYTHLLTTWLLIYVCWRLAQGCFRRPEERWAALLLTAVSLSVPVAGSSLFLMDPYVTGRSFSTPLALLAICFCLEGKIVRAALLVVLAGLFHPLMAIYAAGFLVMLWALKRESSAGVVGLGSAAVILGAVIQYSQRAVVETPAYRVAARARDYYYLSCWHWYELAGLAAPLVLLGLYCLWRRSEGRCQSVVLAKACIAIGVTSIVSCLLFAHPSSRSHLISALQTIRPFLWIYFCMFLLLGGTLGRYLLKQVRWRWALLFFLTAAALTCIQHSIYPASAQVELPGTISRNGWNRAFIWIRDNTPADALVALDADYIHAPGEDAQGFRAIAERGSLADSSKDGGAAAAFPQLAGKWSNERAATIGLSLVADAERLQRLRPFQVSWVVLDKKAGTKMVCPFEDDLVKVCRLQ